MPCDGLNRLRFGPHPDQPNKPVGERRIAVIDVRDDGEFADLVEGSDGSIGAAGRVDRSALGVQS